MISGGQEPAPPRSNEAPAVVLEGIGKRFPGVVANHDVTVRVRRGSVHALVGENGAGKSTLMKILYGMQRPDEGTITVDGREVAFSGPRAAIAAGIGMVHQHFQLADNLTVLENVVLGDEPVAGPWWRRWPGVLDTGAARERMRELGRRYGLQVDPDALVEHLGVGARQRVEILKVLYRGARILILDEPTAVLVPQEVDELFAALRELTAEGLTVVFISHKLDEVLRVADEITVLRRGTTVATVDPRDVTPHRLAELMVGGELPSPATSGSTVTDREVLRVRGLTVRDRAGRATVDGVDLTVRAGEVLGIAGVEGNGQGELVDAIMGIVPASGEVALEGRDLSRASTRARRAAGIAFVPQDRTRQGLLLDAPLWENRILGHTGGPPGVRHGLIDRGAARRDTARIVAEYDVRTPSVDVAAAALSGGNQQKLVIGREMAGGPVLLLAAHPTRGVDVGAQAAIWDQVRRARAGGLAVLLVSADLDELLGLSDRLVVMLRGRLVAEVDPSRVTPQELGSAMTGADAGGSGVVIGTDVGEPAP